PYYESLEDTQDLANNNNARKKSKKISIRKKTLHFSHRRIYFVKEKQSSSGKTEKTRKVES
ncbi:hypothetical protein Q2295_15600, partial [Leptospira interrogans]|uniref:hypothetical protein n=1 Tax=Leptospira interrogans TaxID=173 RepID=UPI001C44FB96